MSDEAPTAIPFQLDAFHRAVEKAIGPDGPAYVVTLTTDAQTHSLPLSEAHAAIEAAFAAAHGKAMDAAALCRRLVDDNARIRTERDAARTALDQAQQLRRRKPTKTIELEKDSTGAVKFAHVFEGNR